IATCTVAPALSSMRTSSAALYAAMPPPTPTTTFAPVSANAGSRGARSVRGPSNISATLADSRRDVLQLRVVLDPVARALAAHPGMLDAAERRLRGRQQTFVDTDHAGLECFGDSLLARAVAREDVGNEAVLGVVCQADRLGLVGCHADRDDWPEDF